MARVKNRLKRKRGRPFKAGEREPNGRLQRGRDLGTPELQARRKWLADQTKCSDPLGILLANSAIGDHVREAAGRLAWLWAVVHGVVNLSAAAYERGYGRALARDPDDPDYQEWLEQREDELNRMLSRLNGVSRRVREDVVSLAIYGHVPNFMRPCFPSLGDRRHAERIKAGFAALVSPTRRGGALRGYRRTG